MSNSINTSELNKLIRTMQDESDQKSRLANNYNELGAEIVRHGVNDKMRARGWPTSSPAKEPPKSPGIL